VLSKVPGTPLADEPDVPIWETVRVVAVARLLMPASVVRLSAGRHRMSFSDQALCFMAGANSLFTSERSMMLTSAVPCADHDTDDEMLRTMGLRPRPLATPVEVEGEGAAGRAAEGMGPGTAEVGAEVQAGGG
jgi:biotin synthase